MSRIRFSNVRARPILKYSPVRKFYTANGYYLLAEIPDWHAAGDGLAVFGKKLG